MNALIIVDIQNDFVPGGNLAVNKGDEIIPLVNELQYYDKFDLIVATQDWHPKEHKSFAANHSGKNIFEQINLNGLEQTLWPIHCVQSTFGAEFVSSLDMKKVEAIFRKGMDAEIDSYSGFFDNGKRKSTGLDSYLKGNNVTEVFVVGLAGDFCVYFTANDALELGFNTSIITTCTRSIDEKIFLEKMEKFKEKGGWVLSF